MTKRYVDEELTLEGQFRTDAGVPTNPTTVTFTYRMSRDGEEQTATVSNPSTGVYQATVTPEEPGNLWGTFKGVGNLTKSVPVHVPVFASNGVQG